jgi:hypothetical protein
MYHLKMEKQMNNTRSARTPTLPELFVGNRSMLLLSQLQVNNQSTQGKSTTTPGKKHPWYQPPLRHASKAMSLVRVACAPDTS